MLLPENMSRARKCGTVVGKRLRESFGRASEAEFLETFKESTPSIKQHSKKHWKHEISRARKCVTVLGKRFRKGFGNAFSSKLLETFLRIPSSKTMPSKHSCSCCFQRICQGLESAELSSENAFGRASEGLRKQNSSRHSQKVRPR